MIIIIIIIIIHAVSDRNTQWRGSFSIGETHFAVATHPSRTQYNPEKSLTSPGHVNKGRGSTNCGRKEDTSFPVA